MSFADRAKVAFACCPAWFVGVLITALVGTASGAIGNSGESGEWLSLWMLLFFMGMLLTIPALLICALSAFVLAPWIAARPILFGALSGLSGPAVFLHLRFDPGVFMTTIFLVVPGVVAATVVFRHVLRAELNLEK